MFWFFKTYMGPRFPAVDFLQYTSGLEVLACSFDTNFKYVIAMLQLRYSLNHVKLQQLLGGR